jgi:hypothetical protein
MSLPLSKFCMAQMGLIKLIWGSESDFYLKMENRMCETDFLLQFFGIKGCMAVRVEPPGAHFQWIFY